MSNAQISPKNNHEIIVFRVGEQEFCINVASVREIRGWVPATPLPHAPTYVRGVINLRGAVLPIIEVAERLGLRRQESNARNVIIVAMVRGQVIGLLVDAVSDIMTVPADVIQGTPDIASETGKLFVDGVLAIEGRLISLLRLENVLPADFENVA